jgi:hypothetical protein
LQLSLKQAVEKYRTVGYAIESAVSSDSWTEVDSLLNERDEILALFAKGKPAIDEKSLGELKACDRHLLEFLTGSRAQAATEIRNLQGGNQARRAYRRSAGTAPAFERAG